MSSSRLFHLRLFSFLCILTILPAVSNATTLPTGFAETQVASGISSPTAMEFAPDGRLFILEQTGRARVLKNGVLLSTPFLSLTVNSSGERGLLGITFDPNFASNHYVYLYYTATSPSVHNRLSRFTANGDTADPLSETILLELPTLNATNHNGGAIHFGLDGKLYVAVGENAVSSNSQTVANLLGKLLRINPDGSVPADNPVIQSQRTAIWALGLRNPFTFVVQPGTGRIFINDVGENSWEEINDGIAGSNYGWPNFEGSAGCSSYRCPIFAYAHGTTTTTGCAITGGAFYNPSTQQFPSEYAGDYFFADYCNNWIRRLDIATNTVTGFATGISSAPVDLKVSSDGSLYYLTHGTGRVYRIQYTANEAPTITSHPVDKTVSAGQSATFSVTASGTPPLSYQWQRNSVDISGATSSSYTLNNAQLADDGALFRCIVTNDFGTATSNEATLTVTVNNSPSASITQPISGTLYTAGTNVNYSGDATDPEDGTLPASAFTWQIDFHHDSHVHPFLPPTTGSKSGSFTIPNTGETSNNVFYRIYLTVTDSGGLTDTVYSDILPRKVNVTLGTNPTGLQLKLDGQPVTAPYAFVGVVGMIRNIEAVSPQGSWLFASWSDGGVIAHNITTPSSSTTYTATYSASAPTGNGLTGGYYDNKDLTNLKVTRIDPVVDFNWGKGSPASGIAVDTFSVRWTGQVQPQFTETYTFYSLTNDGVRLWINGQLIINRWVKNPSGEGSGSIALVGGQKYSIQIEYFEDRNTANARISWSSQSQPKQVIPTARLYSQ